MAISQNHRSDLADLAPWHEPLANPPLPSLVNHSLFNHEAPTRARPVTRCRAGRAEKRGENQHFS